MAMVRGYVLAQTRVHKMMYKKQNREQKKGSFEKSDFCFTNITPMLDLTSRVNCFVDEFNILFFDIFYCRDVTGKRKMR